MRSILFAVGMFALGLVTFSCKTSTILVAKFESDAIGATPGHDLPGDPAGDRVDFIPELASGLKIKTWEAGSTNKALEFTRVNTGGISGHSTWLSFKGISTNLAETVWFIYNAKFGGGSGAEVITDLSDGSGSPIARMKINSAGQIRLVAGDYTTEKLIGTITPGAKHNVMFVVSAASTSYNLLIAAAGHPLIKVDNEPTMTANPVNFHNPCNPSISFNFGESSGSDTKYLVNDVSITREKP